MATQKSSVTASFTVSFSSSSADSILVAEVDDRSPDEGGLNDSTSFSPGDPVWYLIYTGPNVTVVDQIHSWGTHSAGGQLSVHKTETLTFMTPDQLEQSLKYPVQTVESWTWMGNSSVGSPKFNGNKVTVAKTSAYGVGILQVKYTAQANSFKLTHAPLGFPEYEIATLVVGKIDNG